MSAATLMDVDTKRVFATLSERFVRNHGATYADLAIELGVHRNDLCRWRSMGQDRLPPMWHVLSLCRLTNARLVVTEAETEVIIDLPKPRKE